MSKKTKLFLFVAGLFVLGMGTFSMFQPVYQGGETKEPSKETQVKEEEEDKKTQGEWIDIAIAYTASGEPENAIEAYRQAIAIQEVAVIPWINLAALLKEQDEYALARDAYKEFIRIFPLSSQGYSNLGELYVIWQEGSVEDAIEILELGIERTDDAALKRELERLQ